MPTLPAPFVPDASWRVGAHRWDDGPMTLQWTPGADGVADLSLSTGGLCGPGPLAALGAWLAESWPLQQTQASEGRTTWTIGARQGGGPASAGAFGAIAWWMRQVVAGGEPFTALGTLAQAWSRTPLPAATAWAFLPGIGLAGWSPTGAHTAMLHVRGLGETRAMPTLRFAFESVGAGLTPERLAVRAGWCTQRDTVLEQAVDAVRLGLPDPARFGWSCWALEPGMNPDDLRGMIRRVEDAIAHAPVLATLTAEPVHSPLESVGRAPEPAAPPAWTPSFEPLGPAAESEWIPGPESEFDGKAPVEAPEPAPEVLRPMIEVQEPAPEPLPPTIEVQEQSPEVLPPTIEVPEPAPEVLPPTIEVQVPAPEVLPTTIEVQEPAPEVPPPAVEVQVPAREVLPPAVEVQVPAPEVLPPAVEVPEPTEARAPVSAVVIPAGDTELPPPGAPGRYRVHLIAAGPDAGRTAELLARALKLDVDAAWALVAQAPVMVADELPAWEVRKIDVVVRLPSGARFRWERVDLAPGTESPTSAPV